MKLRSRFKTGISKTYKSQKQVKKTSINWEIIMKLRCFERFPHCFEISYLSFSVLAGDVASFRIQEVNPNMYLFFDEYEWPLCEWGDETSKPAFDSKDGNVATEEKQHKDPLTRHLQIKQNSSWSLRAGIWFKIYKWSCKSIWAFRDAVNIGQETLNKFASPWRSKITI